MPDCFTRLFDFRQRRSQTWSTRLPLTTIPNAPGFDADRWILQTRNERQMFSLCHPRMDLLHAFGRRTRRPRLERHVWHSIQVAMPDACAAEAAGNEVPRHPVCVREEVPKNRDGWEEGKRVHPGSVVELFRRFMSSETRLCAVPPIPKVVGLRKAWPTTTEPLHRR